MILKPYDLTIHSATAYRVMTRTPYREWGIATVREWKGGGSLDIQSDYGNYGHIWGCIGPERFTLWLAGLDYDYFMHKTRGEGYRLFCAEETVRAVKRMITESEEAGEISPMRAAQLHAMASRANTTIADSGWFYQQLDPDLFQFVCVDGELPSRTKDNPETRGFWEKIWPLFCDAWRKEVEATGDAA